MILSKTEIFLEYGDSVLAQTLQKQKLEIIISEVYQ